MKAWWDLPWLVYDLETTGVDPEQAHVVQTGVVLWQNGRVFKRKDRFVNPGVPIPEDAARIHGITDSMVSEAEHENTALPNFVNGLAKTPAVLVSFNGFGYDDKVLDARTDGAFSRAMANKIRVDVLVLIRMKDVGEFWPGRGRHKLSSVAGRFRLDLTDEDRLHWATSDCVTTAMVLQHLLTSELYGDKLRKQLPPDVRVVEFLQQEKERQQQRFDEWLKKQPPRE
jgi:DNA polymerase III subunit alpha, Gram-positive type